MSGYNFNRGYVGSKRSMRSLNAINSYEVPLSMIDKQMVGNFLKNHKEDFTEEDLVFLQKVSINKWKFVAKEYAQPASWHHTSSYFNETNHYRLLDVACEIIKIKDNLDENYKKYQNNQKKVASDIKYGVITVEVWGGTRNYPKLEGYKEAAGIIISDWLYYKTNQSINGAVAKLKTNANKVEKLIIYNTYEELAECHKNYQNIKDVFDKLIEEKKVRK